MINNDLSKEFKEITGKDFNEIYKNYKPKLVYFLTKYTKNQEISEDFAEDAFIQALLKIKSFNREKAQIHTWIYKIGENLVIKDFNDRKRFSTVSIDKTNNDNLNMSNLLSCDYDENIEKELLLQKKTDIIKKAIYELPEKYKKVMIMRELKNMSYVGISEACTNEHNIQIKGSKKLPNPKEFLELTVFNNSNKKVNIILTINNTKIMLDVESNSDFTIDSEEIQNVSDIEIISYDKINIYYKTITNLGTIKSQIRAGRELIRNKTFDKIKKLDINGTI